jgi:hypothetical protein
MYGMDETYVHFIYRQDKEWIHGETSHKPRSRCARVWIDEGMITPLLCDPSLLYYIFLDIAIPFILLSFFFRVMLLSMPFFFFRVTISPFFHGYLGRDHITHGAFIWWMDG